MNSNHRSVSLFILAVALVLSIGEWTQAQNLGFNPGSSTASSSASRAPATKGFRISVIRPELNASGSFVIAGDTLNAQIIDGKIEDALGLAIGYAYLPIMSIGWTSNLALIQMKSGGEKSDLGRADVGLAFALTSTFNFKAGVHAAKFTSGEIMKQLDVGTGAQASFGIQINPFVAIDLGYTSTDIKGRPLISQNSATDQPVFGQYQLRTSGFEAALAATF